MCQVFTTVFSIPGGDRRISEPSIVYQKNPSGVFFYPIGAVSKPSQNQITRTGVKFLVFRSKNRVKQTVPNVVDG